MAKPRCEQIDVDNISAYYFITSQCARQSWLCGYDPHTGRNYEHRKQWIEARIHYLNSVFSIDVIGYSVMSNHYHIVLKIHRELVSSWSDKEVVERWLCLFKASDKPYIHRWHNGEDISPEEQDKVNKEIREWRSRLMDISWFMRCLNENIASHANREDNKKGNSFWESRFDSRAIQSEAELLARMNYVDLNPVRAQMADTPEASQHTSFHERIYNNFVTTADLSQGVPESDCDLLAYYNIPVKPLMPFKGGEKVDDEWGLPFSFQDYQQLVDWVGRWVHPEKKGSISESTPPILERLKTDKRLWLNAATQFDQTYHRRLKKYHKRNQSLVVA